MRKLSKSSGYRVQSVIPTWIRNGVKAIPPELSDEAKRRLHWVDFSRKYGIAMAAVVAQINERTIKRWRQALRLHGLKGLEPASCAPKSPRGPQWTPEDVEAVRIARCSEAGRGKGKEILQRLIATTGRVLSVSMVGRILTYLKARREIREPHRIVRRNVRNPSSYAIRRPKGFPPPSQPGNLIQIDTVHLRPLPGVELRQFSAIDVVTRLAITDVRTTRDEFWAWYSGTKDLATVRPAIQRWTSRYNALRLHTSLGYVTPLDTLQSFPKT